MPKLHHAPDTRAGRIVWRLEELRLPCELHRMAFHPRALKSDAHRARHPLGRVPVLEDGEVMLHESGAIVEPLIARHSDGALQPAVDFMLGHACHMARRLGCIPEALTHLHADVKRLEARPAPDKGITA